MLKKIGIPALALLAAMVFMTPAPAQAGVHFGVGVYAAPPVYSYAAPVYPNPYYAPPVYPYDYGYAYPAYGYGGVGVYGGYYGGHGYYGHDYNRGYYGGGRSYYGGGHGYSGGHSYGGGHRR